MSASVSAPPPVGALPPEDELRVLFDAEARRMDPAVAEGRPFELDGPLMRFASGSALVVHAPVDLGLDGPGLEALVERQVRAAVRAGLPVEWKTFARDRPDTLIPLLLAAGFEPEPVEAVMVASSAMPRAASDDDVVIREAHAGEFGEVAALLREIWDADRGWVAAELARLQSLLGDGIHVLVAEADGRLVSAGWVVMRPGERFAGLWGGSTHPGYRRRGIYRALVAERAAIAAARGFPFLRVDASALSRPILDALGFVQFAAITPYVWAP